MVFIAGCAKAPNLDGKWEQQSGSYNILEGLVDVFEFTGKEFVLTQYSDDWSSQEQTYQSGCYGGLCTTDEYNNKELVKESSSENNSYKYYRIITKGTFSISGDRIEFKLADRSVKSYSFSRVENTITINGKDFVNWELIKEAE